MRNILIDTTACSDCIRPKWINTLCLVNKSDWWTAAGSSRSETWANQAGARRRHCCRVINKNHIQVLILSSLFSSRRLTSRLMQGVPSCAFESLKSSRNADLCSSSFWLVPCSACFLLKKKLFYILSNKKTSSTLAARSFYFYQQTYLASGKPQSDWESNFFFLQEIPSAKSGGWIPEDVPCNQLRSAVVSIWHTSQMCCDDC